MVKDVNTRRVLANSVEILPRKKIHISIIKQIPFAKDSRKKIPSLGEADSMNSWLSAHRAANTQLRGYKPQTAHPTWFSMSCPHL